MSQGRPSIVTLVAVMIVESGTDWIRSRDLVDKLQLADPELWGDLDVETLAAELRPFGIRPLPIRRANNAKGYLLKHVAPEIAERVQAERSRRGAVDAQAKEAAHRRALQFYLGHAAAGLSDDGLASYALSERHPVTVGADPCGVYAYYDAGNVLLYVGITGDDVSRHDAHIGSQPWARFIADRVERGTFAHRVAALSEEAHLIRTLQPIFNRTRAGWMAAAAAYLVDHDAAELLVIRGLDGRTGAGPAIREMVAIGAFEHLELKAAEVTA